jgi:hypothetical protein
VPAGTSGEKESHLVKNELDFAAYNERRAAFEAGSDEQMPFVCECGDEQCFQVIDATPDEWEAAHSRNDQFVVAPDHVFPEVESIIERGGRYWIVRKRMLSANG